MKWLKKSRSIINNEKARIIQNFCRMIMKKIRAMNNWRKIIELLTNKRLNQNINDILYRLRILKGLEKLSDSLRNHSRKEIFKQFNKNKNDSLINILLKKLIERINSKNKNYLLNKYFKKWKDIVNKQKEKENALAEMMKILRLQKQKNDTLYIYYVSLLKQFINDLEKVRKLEAFKKIKDFGENQEKNKKLSEDLLKAQNDINKKNISPLVNKLLRIYTYKILNKLFRDLYKLNKRNAKPFLYDFFRRLKFKLDKYKDYSYSNNVKNENKPYLRKFAFRGKSKPNKLGPADDNSRNICKSIIPNFVQYLEKKRKKRLNDTFDILKKYYRANKFCDYLKRFVNNTEYQNKKELVEKLKIEAEGLTNNGIKKAKLFKFLRKIIIKKLFLEKREIQKIYKLLYLINVLYLNKKISRDRWIRQIIRRWRFITFAKAMARKKMELMYKNLHISYLELVNSMFNDEEEINPSLIKEFERFSADVGMFVNEDPYLKKESKEYKVVKKQYIFEPFETKEKKKIVETKKIEEEEVYYSDPFDNKKELKHINKDADTADNQYHEEKNTSGRKIKSKKYKGKEGYSS